MTQIELENKIKQDILKLKTPLQNALESKNKGIYKIQKNIEKFVQSNKPDVTNPNIDPNKFKTELWEQLAKEWAKTLSHEILDILAPQIAKSIAESKFL